MVSLKAKRTLVIYVLIWVVILDVIVLIMAIGCFLGVIGDAYRFGIFSIIFLILLVLIPHLIWYLRILKKKQTEFK